MTKAGAAYLWLVPVLVALIGMARLLWFAYEDGPEITISFLDAEGLESGRTPVRFKDVEVGTVTAVHPSHDHKRVLASVRLTKAAANVAVKDTRFWIMRPRVETRGVSGIGTLRSGTYVGVDSGLSREAASAFTGLENPPAVPQAQQGARYRLHARSLGSIEVGSPVYYGHLDVGQVTATDLAPDGKGVSIEVFVEAPYHHYVSAQTRWWNTGGGSSSRDAQGFPSGMQSLTAMLLGGLAFQSPPGPSRNQAAPAGTAFELAEDGPAVPEPPAGAPAVVVMRFAQSLRGLSVGAVVDFRGLAFGEVTKIGIEHAVGKREPAMLVTMNLYPDRLGQPFRDSAEHADAAAGKALLRKLVADGLRGQLRTGNLLTNQLYVALDLFPNTPPVRLDLNRSPVELPTVPNTLDDLQAVIGEIMRTLDRAPMGPVGTELSRSFVQARRLFKLLDTQLAPWARETLATAKQGFDEAEAALNPSPSLQTDLQPTQERLARAQQTLETLSKTIEQRPETIVWGKTPVS